MDYLKEGSTLDLTKWQHDIYRFNGLPYDVKEINTIKRFCALAAAKEAENNKNEKQIFGKNVGINIIGCGCCGLRHVCGVQQ